MFGQGRKCEYVTLQSNNSNSVDNMSCRIKSGAQMEDQVMELFETANERCQKCLSVVGK
jgi:hypothetical protein